MTPTVSVVMGVYNGAGGVRASVESVLAAQGVDLEFVIVNDGSTDATASILHEMAGRDPRVRIINQSNTGLTGALIRGCAEARGKYIARIDCGDRYLPGRLEAQLAAAREHPEATLVSCGTRFIGPEGEHLYDLVSPPESATQGLREATLGRIRGPSSHGSALFPRELFERAGGYRREFYFAQDLDLWTRLVDLGAHLALQQILYEVSLGLESISSMHREQQLACADAILECARLRRAGLDESPALAVASAIKPVSRGHRDQAGPLYFIGSCLRARGDPRAQKYFVRALKAKPYHLMAALRVLQGIPR